MGWSWWGLTELMVFIDWQRRIIKLFFFFNFRTKYSLVVVEIRRWIGFLERCSLSEMTLDFAFSGYSKMSLFGGGGISCERRLNEFHVLLQVHVFLCSNLRVSNRFYCIMQASTFNKKCLWRFSWSKFAKFRCVFCALTTEIAFLFLFLNIFRDFLDVSQNVQVNHWINN